MNARSLPAGPLFDMFDQFGQALAVGLDHSTASRKAHDLISRPGWLGDIIIRSQRKKSLVPPGEQLWLVSDGLDQPAPQTVHVRSPFGYFGLTLEQALYRIEQFHMADQYRLRAAVEHHFGVGPAPVVTGRQPNPATGRSATTKRTKKES